MRHRDMADQASGTHFTIANLRACAVPRLDWFWPQQTNLLQILLLARRAPGNLRLTDDNNADILQRCSQTQTPANSGTQGWDGSKQAKQVRTSQSKHFKHVNVILIL